MQIYVWLLMHSKSQPCDSYVKHVKISNWSQQFSNDPS